MSPAPAYHNNLADLHFRRGDYDKAIEEYGKVANFPLAALEVAKIYRLQNNLDEAAGREEDAIRWLQQPSVQQAELSRAWAFQASFTKQVRLVSIDDKQCYAELELMVTMFLQSAEGQGGKFALPAALGESGKCHSRKKQLTEILARELRRLGDEVPHLTKRSEEFATKFLSTSIN